MVFIPEGINNYIKQIIRNARDDVNEKLAYTTHDPVALYHELLDDEHMFRVFAQAATYLPYKNFNQIEVISYPTEKQLMLNIQLRAVTEMPQYFVPVQLFRPTPESNVMQAMQTAIRMDTDWMTTITMYEIFCCFDARVVGMLFPWVKNIMLDCPWLRNEASRGWFVSQWNLTKINDKIIDQAIAQLIEGKPTQFPSLTPAVNAACRLGNQLFAQAVILKDTPDPKNSEMAQVASVLDYNLLDPQLIIEAHDVVKHWKDEQTNRHVQSLNQRRSKNPA